MAEKFEVVAPNGKDITFSDMKGRKTYAHGEQIEMNSFVAMFPGFFKRVEDAVKEVVADAKEAVEEIVEKVEEQIEEIKEEVAEAVETAEEVVEAVVEEVKEAAAEIEEKVEGIVEKKTAGKKGKK